MPKQPESALENQSAPRRGKKYFTLDEARRALPLVKRIAADIQATQTERLRLHAELSSGTQVSPETTLRQQEQLEQQTDRLETLVEELSKMGVDLKDPGRVLLDFPAMHENREILLCWKADEATITHWHELDGGFSGRRPVEELTDHAEHGAN